jgi:hypothetical protein
LISSLGIKFHPLLAFRINFRENLVKPDHITVGTFIIIVVTKSMSNASKREIKRGYLIEDAAYKDLGKISEHLQTRRIDTFIATLDGGHQNKKIKGNVVQKSLSMWAIKNHCMGMLTSSMISI